MPLRRNRNYIWLVAIPAVVGLLLALAFKPTRVDKWEAMADGIDKLQVKARSRKLPRSVLREKLIPGKAWDEYNAALNDATQWVDDQNGGLFARFVNGGKGVDHVKVRALVADHAETIEQLRLGTRRSDGQYPYNWERGYEMPLPSLMGIRRLANDAIAQARIWTEAGRPQDAADILLDLTVFARDTANNATLLSSLIGFAVYSSTFDELRNLLLSGKLTPKGLDTLAKKLEIVDQDFPRLSSTLSNETMLSSSSLLAATNAGFLSKAWWELATAEGVWQFALAPKTMMLGAVAEKDGFLRRAERFDQLEFSEAKKEAKAISAKASGSRHGIVRLTSPDLLKIVVVQRDALARLRLLRAGANFLGGGQIRTLADPFGTTLLYDEAAGQTKIWSIGSDAKNDNGVGNWEGQPDILFGPMPARKPAP